MKLNHLKKELKKWSDYVQKTNENNVVSPIGIRETRTHEKTNPGSPGYLRAFKSEKVVGGDIKWKPVDTQAAKMIMKSSCWSYAPVKEAPKKQIEIKLKKERKHKMSKNDDNNIGISEGWDSGDVKTKIIGGEVYYNMHDVSVKVIEEINKQPQKLTALARAALDARAVLDENMRELGGASEDFNAKIKVSLEQVRQTRFAFVKETSEILAPLKELRQFFLGSSHETEIARLKEFADLCERLQKLKASGFLDSIADTMIKLS